VNALISIVKALPASFAPAMLVVMHVPPERPSSLACLLGEHCALPVAEALDKQPIEAGTVTLAPSGYHMLVEPGRSIALSFDEPVLFSRPAIDPTFESAALAWRERIKGSATRRSRRVVHRVRLPLPAPPLRRS